MNILEETLRTLRHRGWDVLLYTTVDGWYCKITKDDAKYESRRPDALAAVLHVCSRAAVG